MSNEATYGIISDDVLYEYFLKISRMEDSNQNFLLFLVEYENILVKYLSENTGD